MAIPPGSGAGAGEGSEGARDDGGLTVTNSWPGPGTGSAGQSGICGVEQPANLDAARMRATLGLSQTSPPPLAAASPAPPPVVAAVPARIHDESARVDHREPPPHRSDDELMTRAEAAKFLHVCTKTLDKLVKERGLPFVMIGAKRKGFWKSELITRLNANRLTQSPTVPGV